MSSLECLEAVIERGKLVYTEVGNALREIQEGKLYRDHGYATFEDYCKQRWGFSRSVGYDYINAARVGSTLQNQTNQPSFTQAIELARLEPEQQRHVAHHTDFSNRTVVQLKRVIVDELQLKNELDRAEAYPTVPLPTLARSSRVKTLRSPFEELQNSGKLQRFELSSASVNSGVTCSLGRYELHLYGISETQARRIAEALQ